MTTKQEIVKSIPHMRELLKAGNHTFHIVLAGGLVRSRKIICPLKNGRLAVYNHVDDSQQALSEEELSSHSNIGEAIEKGCLVAELQENIPHISACLVCGKELRQDSQHQ